MALFGKTAITFLIKSNIKDTNKDIDISWFRKRTITSLLTAFVLTAI